MATARLAAALVLALGAAAPPAAATAPPPTRPAAVVTNCNDDGPGSLRAAVAGAVSGDVIDLTALTCSTITLTTGAIATGARDLSLVGPGAFALTIDAQNRDRAFLHLGTGRLSLSGLWIDNGRKYQPDGFAKGGCIASSGRVALDHVFVTRCEARSNDAAQFALGGAVYARTGIDLVGGAIYSSTATDPAAFANGGGLFTPGQVTMTYALMKFNRADLKGGAIFAGGGVAIESSFIGYGSAHTGGGIYANGNVDIRSTTIASNSAAVAGGLMAVDVGGTSALRIVGSTISTNAGAHAGVRIDGFPAAAIANSTIAFNQGPDAGGAAAGVSFAAGTTLELQSTILADNRVDLGGATALRDLGSDAGGGIAPGSANNLVTHADVALPLPFTSAEPRLFSLSWSNGFPPTHPLSPTSPAVDAGNNAAGLAFDERGPGHPRVIGAAADIGAYELDLADVIFADGLD
jgi:hypothetical protein